MKIAPHILPVYIIIEKSFGNKINQHQYEGLITLLYDSMCQRNIGTLLSHFTDKQEAVITADVGKYYHNAKSQYVDMEKKLNENGFAQWLSAFDFQVSNNFEENGIHYVEGRLIEGEILSKHNKIYSMRTADRIEAVDMEIVSIEACQKQLAFLSLGMTARLGIRIIKPCSLDINNTVLSSQQIT